MKAWGRASFNAQDLGIRGDDIDQVALDGAVSLSGHIPFLGEDLLNHLRAEYLEMPGFLGSCGCMGLIRTCGCWLNASHKAGTSVLAARYARLYNRIVCCITRRVS